MTNDQLQREQALDAARIAYSYQGKPLAWQHGFDRGFLEGWQAARAPLLAEIERLKIELITASTGTDNATKAEQFYREAESLITQSGGLQQATFIDEIDAALAGNKWLTSYQQSNRELWFTSLVDDTPQMPRIKWAALFDSNDKLFAAYLLTRDQFNRTQITYVSPAPQPDQSQRDAAWAEITKIRATIKANPEESTFDEVDRIVHLNGELLDALKDYVATIAFKGGTDEQAVMEAIRSADNKARAVISKVEASL